MPNYCTNYITISGNKTNIKKIKKFVSGKSEGGVVWDGPSSWLETDEPNQLSYTIDTARVPCTEVIQELSKNFPKVQIEIVYEEAGMGFAGRAVFVGGNVVEEEDLTEYYITKVWGVTE